MSLATLIQETSEVTAPSSAPSSKELMQFCHVFCEWGIHNSQVMFLRQTDVSDLHGDWQDIYYISSPDVCVYFHIYIYVYVYT